MDDGQLYLHGNKDDGDLQLKGRGGGGSNQTKMKVRAIYYLKRYAEWSAKEGVPSGMVRYTSWCISLSHYVVHFFTIAYLWMMAVQCHILNYFVLNHCCHAAEGSWWKR